MMAPLNRREVISTLASTTVLSLIATDESKAQEPINVGDLRELIISQRLRTLLLARFNVVRTILTANLLRSNSEYARFDDIDGFDGNQNLNESLSAFYNGIFTEELILATNGDGAASLVSSAAQNAQQLVSNIAGVLEEEGVLVDSPQGQELLNSVVAIEELNALQRGVAGASAFLCQFAPIRYFCR